MELFFLPALALGFLGSLHCVGMCGPIAMLLPHNGKSAAGLIPGRVLYNLGRVITYSLLGLAFGLLGQGVKLYGLQQGFSIVLGSVILLIALLPAKVKQKFAGIPAVAAFNSKLLSVFAGFTKGGSPLRLFLFGMANGILPCGFVYLGLAGAVAQENLTHSVLFMSGFGLGTFPAMFAVSYFPAIIKWKGSFNPRRLVPVFSVVMAFILIMRGLNLGIPYLSPKFEGSGTKVKAACCEDPKVSGDDFDKVGEEDEPETGNQTP